MLTADLVNARRRGGELFLVAFDVAGRARACAIAGALLAQATSHVGRSREELVAALSAIDVGAREYRLKDGLAKLIEDRCDFGARDGAGDPAALRNHLFALASLTRAQLAPGERFDRRAVIAQVAQARGLSPDTIEHALFSDLRGAQVLIQFDAISAEALVACYERAQAQAVLLRAVKVTIDVQCESAGALRVLFQKLRFLRLLHTIERSPKGHRIIIDGPFSLFESVTKYGLQLALVVPILEACHAFQLEADIRWGKDRTPLLFRLSGGQPSFAADAPGLPDEVQALVESFNALGTDWEVSPNTDILELPGIGLSVPDLSFCRGGPGRSRLRVYLEVMGFWSRAAVWRRVELVQAGLAERVLFAVSSSLRVSEDVLDGDLPSALYVYKRTMSARVIAERLDGMATARGVRRRGPAAGVSARRL